MKPTQQHDTQQHTEQAYLNFVVELKNINFIVSREVSIFLYNSRLFLDGSQSNSAATIITHLPAKGILALSLRGQ